MAIHIKELHVNTFKGISQIELKNLNHINIITGDNNSGKTSLLELISIINNPKDLSNWVKKGRPSNISYEGRIIRAIGNVFPVDGNSDNEVKFSYVDGLGQEHCIGLRRKFGSQQITKAIAREIENYGLLYESDDADEVFDAEYMQFTLTIDGQDQKSKRIYDFQRTFRGLTNKNDSSMQIAYVTPYDYANNLNLRNILLDNLLYDNVLGILKEFDNNIVRLTVDVGNLNSKSEYMIVSKEHSKALPLNAYGDGMKKALTLLSAVVSARDGILLVDEFETAIHTSAMNNVFSWLLKSAEKYNVQIFLTSHSKEAIDKVLRCDSYFKDKIHYYTLFNYLNKHYVRSLSCEEAIRLQDEGGMDLR